MSWFEEIWKIFQQVLFIACFLLLAISAVFIPEANMFNLGTVAIIAGMYGLSATIEEND